MVRVGESFEHQKIVIKIVEVKPYFDPSNRRCLMVGIILIDGKYTSPVYHFWMGKNEEIRTHIEKCANDYLSHQKAILGIQP